MNPKKRKQTFRMPKHKKNKIGTWWSIKRLEVYLLPLNCSEICLHL